MAEDRERGFRDFFDAEFMGLRRFAYLLTSNWIEAEDLAQETMLRTYRAWDRIRGTTPAAYARATLVNRHRSMLRRAKVEAKYAFARRTPDEVVHERDDSVVLFDAIGTLPPRERQVLVLRFYEDLSIQECARILAVPSGTVKSMTHRALARLRDKLGDAFELSVGDEA